MDEQANDRFGFSFPIEIQEEIEQYFKYYYRHKLVKRERRWLDFIHKVSSSSSSSFGLPHVESREAHSLVDFYHHAHKRNGSSRIIPQIHIPHVGGVASSPHNHASLKSPLSPTTTTTTPTKTKTKSKNDSSSPSSSSSSSPSSRNGSSGGNISLPVYLKYSPEIHRSKHSRELKSLIRKGVPHQLRRSIWLVVSGAYEKMVQNPNVFSSLVALGEADESKNENQQSSSSSSSSSPTTNSLTPFEISIDQIAMDVPRTFPHHQFFQDECVLARLQKILVAFARYDPHVGYCQSMNFLVGFLLFVLTTSSIEHEKRRECVLGLHNHSTGSSCFDGYDPDSSIEDDKDSRNAIDEEVFWIFTCLVHEILPAEYYTESMIGVHIDQFVLRDLVKEKFARVSQLLRYNRLDLPVLTTQWFLVCFLNCCSTDSVLRIWDSLFYEGDKMLFRISLALFKMALPQLLDAGTPQPFGGNGGGGGGYIGGCSDRLFLAVRAMPETQGVRTDDLMNCAFRGFRQFGRAHVDALRNANSVTLRNILRKMRADRAERARLSASEAEKKRIPTEKSKQETVEKGKIGNGDEAKYLEEDHKEQSNSSSSSSSSSSPSSKDAKEDINGRKNSVNDNHNDNSIDLDVDVDVVEEGNMTDDTSSGCEEDEQHDEEEDNDDDGFYDAIALPEGIHRRHQSVKREMISINNRFSSSSSSASTSTSTSKMSPVPPPVPPLPPTGTGTVLPLSNAPVLCRREVVVEYGDSSDDEDSSAFEESSEYESSDTDDEEQEDGKEEIEYLDIDQDSDSDDDDENSADEKSSRSVEKPKHQLSIPPFPQRKVVETPIDSPLGVFPQRTSCSVGGNRSEGDDDDDGE